MITTMTSRVRKTDGLPAFKLSLLILVLHLGIALSDEALHCTNKTKGLPSCDFDQRRKGLCNWQSRRVKVVGVNGNVGWTKKKETVTTNDGSIEVENKGGGFVIFNVIGKDKKIGSKARFRNQIKKKDIPSTGAVCITFRYASLGKAPELILYSRHNRLRSKDVQWETVANITDATKGKWKEFSYEFCLGENAFILFESQMVSRDTIVALDDIVVAESTMECKGEGPTTPSSKSSFIKDIKPSSVFSFEGSWPSDGLHSIHGTGHSSSESHTTLSASQSSPHAEYITHPTVQTSKQATLYTKPTNTVLPSHTTPLSTKPSDTTLLSHTSPLYTKPTNTTLLSHTTPLYTKPTNTTLLSHTTPLHAKQMYTPAPSYTPLNTKQRDTTTTVLHSPFLTDSSISSTSTANSPSHSFKSPSAQPIHQTLAATPSVSITPTKTLQPSSSSPSSARDPDNNNTDTTTDSNQAPTNNIQSSTTTPHPDGDQSSQHSGISTGGKVAIIIVATVVGLAIIIIIILIIKKKKEEKRETVIADCSYKNDSYNMNSMPPE